MVVVMAHEVDNKGVVDAVVAEAGPEVLRNEEARHPPRVSGMPPKSSRLLRQCWRGASSSKCPQTRFPLWGPLPNRSPRLQGPRRSGPHRLRPHRQRPHRQRPHSRSPRLRQQGGIASR